MYISGIYVAQCRCDEVTVPAIDRSSEADEEMKMKRRLLFIMMCGISFIPAVFGGMGDLPKIRQTGEQSSQETMEYAGAAIGCNLSASKKGIQNSGALPTSSKENVATPAR